MTSSLHPKQEGDRIVASPQNDKGKELVAMLSKEL